MKPVYCIAGPTASGKSAYALSLAKKLDGEIVNADALQVYRDLQILSARPTQQEMAGVAHHLFGHISISERYSTGRWIKAVEPLIIEILARDKAVILVGGTGLYFKALTEGLAEIPDPGAAAQKQAQTILQTRGIEALRAQAEMLDAKASARVLGHDPQRLLRIVAVALGTGVPLSQWQKKTRAVLPQSLWRGRVLLPDRARLYARINSRYREMVLEGGLQEAKRIHALNLARDLPGLKAIGLKELLAYLDGELELEAAIKLAQQQTRRFAKRQLTWLRGNMADWQTVVPRF